MLRADTKYTKVRVSRFATNPNPVWMKPHGLETMPRVERQCSGVSNVNQQLKLFYTLRACLAHHSVHQNLGCSAPLMGRSHVEGPNLGAVTGLIKCFPSKAAISDQRRCVEYTPRGAAIKNSLCFLGPHGIGFFGGDKKAKREVARPLAA